MNTVLITPLRGFVAACLMQLLLGSALAQVSPNGYVTNDVITLGQSTNLVRDGSTPAGFAWSEATLWHPDGGNTVLGHVYENPHVQQVTPSAGPGTYWIQFRLVDANYAFEDQWISIQVNGQANQAPTVWLVPTSSFAVAGGKIVQVTSGASDADGNLNAHYIGYTENPGNAITSTGASGGSSTKSASVFVPTHGAQLIYAVAKDSSGASHSTFLLLQ